MKNIIPFPKIIYLIFRVKARMCYRVVVCYRESCKNTPGFKYISASPTIRDVPKTAICGCFCVLRKVNLKNPNANTAKINQTKKRNMKKKEKRRREKARVVRSRSQWRYQQLNRKNRKSHRSWSWRKRLNRLLIRSQKHKICFPCCLGQLFEGQFE